MKSKNASPQASDSGKACIGSDACSTCYSFDKSIFHTLSGVERHALTSRAIIMSFKKGQSIISEGREAPGFFCVRAGTVKLALETITGESMTIRLFANNGVFGHHCLICDTAMYTAVCLTDCELCFFPKDDVQDYINKDPRLLKEINRFTVQEVKKLNEVILSLRSKSIIQRLAEAILDLHSLFGTDTRGHINIDLTKQELSNIVGSSIESVFRAMASLKDKKYVDQAEKRIKILDELRLKKMARAY